MTYIGVPVTTDPDVIAQAAWAYLQAQIPGLVPNDNSLLGHTIAAWAQMLATSRDVASIVPDQIFEYYGNTVQNLPPIAAAPATVTATITVQDNAGYTIPAGTQFGFQVTGSQTVVFTNIAAIVIPPGSTTAVGVTLTAFTPGAAANGLTGTMIAVTPLAFITAAAATTVSAGGVDAETSTAYLGRLVETLQLATPRPVRAPDFAVLARSVAGVYRAIGIDGYSPGRVDAGAGTTNLSPVITDANIQATDLGRTVVGSANVPAGNFVGTVTPGVSFRLSSSATAQVDVNATGTGAVSLTLGALTNQERTVAVSAVDASGNAVSGTIQANITSYLQSLREINFIVNWVAPTYTTVNVVYAVHLTSGAVWTSVQAAVNAAIQNYLSQATWGGGGTTPPGWDPASSTVRYLQLAGIIEAVAGVDYVSSLTLNGVAGDIPLTGVAPLANYGTITGSSV